MAWSGGEPLGGPLAVQGWDQGRSTVAVDSDARRDRVAHLRT